ncbi:MAG: adenosylcobinamide amidohydrolase, partial [Acidimicrobiia bacterium]|nr:adenosylcobinamide amidohydrolase [Acidimicrobiia bacterium]
MIDAATFERSTYADPTALGGSRPVLVWRARAPFRAAASTVLGGGIGNRAWIVNAQVGLDYGHEDPAQHVAALAVERGGLPAGRGVGFLTAAPVLAVAVA